MLTVPRTTNPERCQLWDPDRIHPHLPGLTLNHYTTWLVACSTGSCASVSDPWRQDCDGFARRAIVMLRMVPPNRSPTGLCITATDGPPGPSMAPQTVPLGTSVAPKVVPPRCHNRSPHKINIIHKYLYTQKRLDDILVHIHCKTEVFTAPQFVPIHTLFCFWCV